MFILAKLGQRELSRITAVVHPFIFAFFPIAHALAQNPGEVNIHQAVNSALVLALLTILLLAITGVMVRDLSRAGLVTSGFILVGFLHGGLLALTGSERIWIVLGIEVFLVAAVIVVSVRVRRPGNLVLIANVMGAVLLALSIGQILLNMREETRARRDGGSGSWTSDPAFTLVPDDSSPPDIYYIVLDAYARADALQEFYGYENSGFIEYLQGKGFSVASSSRTNYLSTKLLIPSVLNLEYLDGIAGKVGRKSRDVWPLEEISHVNKVVTALRNAGYRIVNIRSGPDYVALGDPDEDLILRSSFWNPTEFESVLMEMTILPTILRQLPRGMTSRFEREKVLYSIEELGKQADRPGPKFVFAHIMSPHQPFLFGPDGEPRYLHLRLFQDHSPVEMERYGNAYRDQVKFLNEEMKQTIDTILSRSKRPPIIVLQGDHGLRLRLKKRVEDTCLKESFAILNAYYLPPTSRHAVEAAPQVAASTSPVNSFRLVFNRYFGTELNLLEDRSYFSHRYGIYDFVDVTNRAETCAPRDE